MALTKEHFDKSLKLWKEESNNHLQSRIDKMSEDLKNSFRSNLEEASKKVQQLESTVEEQSKQIVKLETEVKKRNVMFHNIPERETSVNNIREIVTELIRNEVDSNFTLANIDYCHRIGKVNEQKVRPVVLALTTLTMKEILLRNKKTLGNKNISISEDLPNTIRSQRRELRPLSADLIAKGNRVIFKGSSIIVNGIRWSDTKAEEELSMILYGNNPSEEDRTLLNKRLRSPELFNEKNKQVKVNHSMQDKGATSLVHNPNLSNAGSVIQGTQ